MLTRGRIPLTAAETVALEKLLNDHAGLAASFSRTEPGESGPVRVEINGHVWLIDEDGNTTEVDDG